MSVSFVHETVFFHYFVRMCIWKCEFVSCFFCLFVSKFMKKKKHYKNRIYESSKFSCLLARMFLSCLFVNNTSEWANFQTAAIQFELLFPLHFYQSDKKKTVLFIEFIWIWKDWDLAPSQRIYDITFSSIWIFFRQRYDFKFSFYWQTLLSVQLTIKEFCTKQKHLGTDVLQTKRNKSSEKWTFSPTDLVYIIYVFISRIKWAQSIIL